MSTKFNSTPFSLSTPRNIPLTLRPKVQVELQRMESLGVVTEPTPWCAAMVGGIKSLRGSLNLCRASQQACVTRGTSYA